MKGLHTAVCLKFVPRSEEVGVNRETMTLDRSRARSEINPPDMNALETALVLKDRHGGRVTLLSMGPPFFMPALATGLAMGADAAYLLSDRAFGGADTLATSLTLATAIRKLGDVDLVLCGEESSDGATAQVPPGIAAWLDLPQATYASVVEYHPRRRHVVVSREVRDGEERLDAPLPAVVSVRVGANEPRFIEPDRWPLLEAEDVVTVWNAGDLELDASQVGLAGSPTSVAGLRQASGAGERQRRMIAGSPEEEARVLYHEIARYMGWAVGSLVEQAGAVVAMAETSARRDGGMETRVTKTRDAPAAGQPVCTADGALLGEVSAVRGHYFEVSGGPVGQPRYWLEMDEVIGFGSDGRVTVFFDQDDLEDHKIGHESD